MQMAYLNAYLLELGSLSKGAVYQKRNSYTNKNFLCFWFTMGEKKKTRNNFFNVNIKIWTYMLIFLE